MPRVYADLDVVALTSRNEGSPVSLIEALASARPVVSTAVGGVPEVVVDGETGLTVPSGNANAVADAILRMLREPELAARLGAAGRRHVYPRYDSSRLVDDVKNLYLRELALRGRARSQRGSHRVMARVLVTGGAGFIGSHLIERSRRARRDRLPRWTTCRLAAPATSDGRRARQLRVRTRIRPGCRPGRSSGRSRPTWSITWRLPWAWTGCCGIRCARSRPISAAPSTSCGHARRRSLRGGC